MRRNLALEECLNATCLIEPDNLGVGQRLVRLKANHRALAVVRDREQTSARVRGFDGWLVPSLDDRMSVRRTPTHCACDQTYLRSR
jgi:hypothetical protein